MSVSNAYTGSISTNMRRTPPGTCRSSDAACVCKNDESKSDAPSGGTNQSKHTVTVPGSNFLSCSRCCNEMWIESRNVVASRLGNTITPFGNFNLATVSATPGIVLTTTSMVCHEIEWSLSEAGIFLSGNFTRHQWCVFSSQTESRQEV